MTAPRLILASASPRRRELLASIGLEAEVRPADIDEAVLPGETPAAYARRLALEKASALVCGEGDVVIAADTVVALGTEIFGKPEDDADAARMLGRLSGRVHDVITAVAVRGPAGVEVDHEQTAVRVADLAAADIAAYIATGEHHDKAGSYAIQGAFAVWIDHVDGTWTNVVGLPLALLRRLLAPHGVDPLPAKRRVTSRT